MSVTYNGVVLDTGKGLQVQMDPEFAVEVLQAIMKYRQEQRMLEIQKLRAEGQVWAAHYLRYGAPHETEHFSENDAVAFLASSWEEGDLQPVSIVCPGNVVIIEEELGGMLNTWIDAQDRD